MASVSASLQIRRDSEIYSASGGWFQARWHFSFDRYYDPSNMGIGKLRVFNHDTLMPGAVWPMHPHRDVEGITYVVAGTFEHADSLGNDGVLSAGSVQRMTLGSGASHSERNHSKTEPMQFIQMWIMPSRPGLIPSVQQIEFDVEDRRNKLLQIVHPEGQDGTGVIVHQDASLHVSRLEPSVTVEYEFLEGHVGYFYLISGAIDLNDERLTAGDAAKILESGAIVIRGVGESELILVDVPL